MPGHNPLAALVAQYNAAGGFPRLHITPEGPGWVPVDVLLAPGGAELPRRMREYADRSGCPAETVASLFTGWIAGAFLRPLVLAYQAAHCLPLPSPPKLQLRFHEGGWPDGAAIGPAPLAVLAIEPMPAQPGIRQVPDAHALRELLSTEIRKITERTVEAMRHTCRLGRRTLHGLITDTVVTSFLLPHPFGAAAEHAAAEANRVLAASNSRIGPPRWIRAANPTRSGMVPVATACCLSYKAPDGQHCALVCPKIDEDTRSEQIDCWLTVGTQPLIA